MNVEIINRKLAQAFSLLSGNCTDDNMAEARKIINELKLATDRQSFSGPLNRPIEREVKLNLNFIPRDLGDDTVTAEIFDHDRPFLHPIDIRDIDDLEYDLSEHLIEMQKEYHGEDPTP